MSKLERFDSRRSTTGAELAVPYAIRRALPASILAELEVPLSARGDLNVFGVLPEPGREGEVPPVYRTVEIGETIHQAYVYGRRLEAPTRRNIPLNGIVLNNLAALSSDPVRLLGPEEAADARRHWRQRTRSAPFPATRQVLTRTRRSPSGRRDNLLLRHRPRAFAQ